MKIYALGTTPDQFTGWGGAGSPIYGDRAATNTSLGSLQSTSLNTSTASGEPNGWGYGCLWLPFTQTVTDFWFSSWGSFNGQAAATEAALANYSCVVFHFSNGNYMFMRASTTVNYAQRLILSPSLTDSTQFVDLGIPYTAALSTVTKLNFYITGCGTTSGTIAWYNDATPIGKWTGDLTNYPSVTAVSFHRDSTSNSAYLTIAYGLASDVCTIGHTLNYEVISGTQGTRADWAGDTTSFTEYPVDYTTTDGLYAVKQSDTCTFKPTKTYSLPTTTGAQLGTVVLQGSMVSDVTDATIAPFVLDGTTSGVGTSTTLSTAGKSYSFNLSTNPATGAAWTMADINAAELGFVRTDSDVKPSTYALDITETTTNYDVASAAKSAGWDGTSPVDITVTVASGVVVGSTVYTSPAMTFASTLSGSTVSLINNGYIVGAGGIPANDLTNANPVTAQGGPALSVATALSITNNGVIGGGGGAGRPGIDLHASPNVIYSGGYGAGYVTGGDATVTTGGTSSARADGTTFAGGAAGVAGSSDPTEEHSDFNKASPGGGGGLGAAGGAAEGLSANGTAYDVMTTHNVAGAAVIGSGTVTWVTKGSVYG